MRGSNADVAPPAAEGPPWRRSTAAGWAVAAVAVAAFLGVSPAVAHDEAARDDAGIGASPMTLIVSLDEQEVHVYRGLERIGTSRVSTGTRRHPTPAGIYSILQKRKWHRSNIYSAAPMPYMQRITWSGIALHAGVVPNRPASHGCIRLPRDFAKDLFGKTDIGAHVVVARGMPSPERIEHPLLFQPRPPALLTARPGSDGSPADPVRVATASLLEADSPAIAAQPAATGPGDRRVGFYVGDLERDLAAAKLATATDEAGPEAPAEAVAVVVEGGEGPAQPAPADRPVGLYLADLETDLAHRAAYAARSAAPLRILITRRTGRERVMDLQRLLAELGHDPGEIDGYMGSDTGAAIQSFQRANAMAPTGMLTDELIDAVYRAAGRPQPTGHIYVRQDYKDVLDAAVDIAEPELPLGTHMFTAMKFAPDARHADWIAIAADAEGTPGAAAVLDRLTIAADVRDRIQAMLTPGSSLIVSDSGLGRETGKGTDFIVQF